ncbi:hypothetical protein JZ751_015391, partial [Albula glossodonta]
MDSTLQLLLLYLCFTAPQSPTPERMEQTQLILLFFHLCAIIGTDPLSDSDTNVPNSGVCQGKAKATYCDAATQTCNATADIATQVDDADITRDNDKMEDHGDADEVPKTTNTYIICKAPEMVTVGTEMSSSSEDLIEMATTTATESDTTEPETVDSMSETDTRSPSSVETQASSEDLTQMTTATTESDITENLTTDTSKSCSDSERHSANDFIQMATLTDSDSTEQEEIDFVSRKAQSLPKSSEKKPVARTLKKAAMPESSAIRRSKATLTQSLSLLNSDSWEKRITGLNTIAGLARECPDAVDSKLRETNLVLTQQVMNLRSVVCRAAVHTLGEMYTHLQSRMDRELEITAKALLQRASTANEFIRQDIDAALDCMVQHCSPGSVIKALLAGGQKHLSSVVRACTAQHLQSLLLRTGPDHALSDAKDITERILPAVVRLAQDPSQEARRNGRQMVRFLATHDKFDTMAKKYLTANNIRDLRGIAREEFPNKPSKKPLQDCGMKKSQANVRFCSQAEKEDYTSALKAKMRSTDFKTRLEAIDTLVSDCEQRPNLVLACKFPVFDAVVDRLQESNRKVNQHTLEALQKIVPLLKDGMGPVVNILVPAVVDNHLNSKIEDIHKAAVGALDSLLEHLGEVFPDCLKAPLGSVWNFIATQSCFSSVADNALLLDVLVTKSQVISGKAKGHLIQKLSVVVANVYTRKPQTVEKKVLPLLWKQLVSANDREQTTALCRALYVQMGQQLRESAATQPMG